MSEETVDEPKEEEAEDKASVKPEVRSEKEILLEKIEDLEAQVKELSEAKLRIAADTENYKKRILRDKETAVAYANESLIKDLIDPIDNFSRALLAADQNEDFKSLKDGVSMIDDQLKTILKGRGLEEIEADGKPFDPSVMEAYSMQEKDDLEEETVIAVFQTGFKLHGKVLRTAKVMVGKPASK